ncbi:Nuclear pore complex, rNpl4 component (sc Npl4) (ISS) [Corchorus olitorius]|uniref:Nuclear pore complex, rNpl4 component (Sc Npl4) (ISS) n=1 Tax=Corchorus olitorius TaxID=93759 RepID=A0A1R3KZS4_9ROSI|nr:Nuclear pore complex, rNpl4 component (sc Npl4) (ISS) [Corchorus olitorius]
MKQAISRKLKVPEERDLNSSAPGSIYRKVPWMYIDRMGVASLSFLPSCGVVAQHGCVRKEHFASSSSPSRYARPSYQQGRSYSLWSIPRLQR